MPGITHKVAINNKKVNIDRALCYVDKVYIKYQYVLGMCGKIVSYVTINNSRSEVRCGFQLLRKFVGKESPYNFPKVIFLLLASASAYWCHT